MASPSPLTEANITFMTANKGNKMMATGQSDAASPELRQFPVISKKTRQDDLRNSD